MHAADRALYTKYYKINGFVYFKTVSIGTAVLLGKKHSRRFFLIYD